MFAKKSLGQNFLKSKAALRAIVETARLLPDDIVLEVGPGKGILTKSLLEKGVKVLAVEKDDRLIPFLQKKFEKEMGSGQLVLVNEDILNFDPARYGLEARSYKLIANPPYYITGALIRMFLSGNFQPKKMVLLLQREVAKRIVASNKKESILSLSVKAYGSPKYILTVERRYFSPKPAVDSAILLIDDISKNFFKEVSEEKFFSVLKKAFSQKRKKLINNFDYPKELVENIFKKLKMDQNIRAEDLTLNTFKEIVSRLP